MIIQPALATLFVCVFFIRSKYISNIACIKVLKTKSILLILVHPN